MKEIAMLMFKHLPRLAVLALLLAPVTSVAQEQIGDGFWTADFQRLQNSARITMALRLANEDGHIAVCGSFYTDGGNNTRRLSKKSLEFYLVSTDTTPVFRNLTYMKEVRSEEDLFTEQNCRLSDVPWFDGANDNVVVVNTKPSY